MTKLPTTEELINADGTIDEGAAGQAIDAVMREDKKAEQEQGLGENESTSETDDKEPVKEEESTVDDDESDGDDWVTSEDIQELVESLGYSEEDLSEFETQEEFERHVRFMDREMSKRIRPGDDQEHALQADEIARKKAEREEQAEQQYRENGKFARQPEELPQLDPDEFDERLIEVLEARDARIAQLEQQILGSHEQQILKTFDTLVDSIGHEDLFGNSENLKAADRAQREKLWEATKTILNGMEASGKQVNGVNRGIIVRALNMEFADTLQKKTRQSLTKKAKRQSSRITGSSRRNSTKNYDGPVEKHPDLLQAFKDFESENG